MSKKQSIPATVMECADCGEEVTLGRSEHRTLRVVCACDGRSVKMSELLPGSWST